MSASRDENFTINVTTFSRGKANKKQGIRTYSFDGAFRIVINPLDHGERSKTNLQVTGYVTKNGLLEIRVGQANQDGSENGEQMIMETVRDSNTNEWLEDGYANPRRGIRSGRRYKRKA